MTVSRGVRGSSCGRVPGGIPSGATRSARPRAARPAARAFLLYLSLCWGMVLMRAVGSALALGTLLLALTVLVTVTLVVVVRRGRACSGYPSAAFRLFVVRPVLHARLLLPVPACGSPTVSRVTA